MSEKVTFQSPAERDDEVFHPEPRPGARIRFGDQDEESGKHGVDALSTLNRTTSNTSQMSQRSVRTTSSLQGRRGSIDPAVALPTTYRTVSYAIEETRAQKEAEAVRAKQDATAELGDIEWHTLSINEVETRLSTSLVQGLSKEQVTTKQKEFGKNVPSKPPSDLISRLFGYMFGGFGSILLIGGILVTITYEPLGKPDPSQANLALAIVLYAVFVIQAVFNGWQDWSSSRTMASVSIPLPTLTIFP
jgi:sodium/potassium-transporting ATPase subunit alpha